VPDMGALRFPQNKLPDALCSQCCCAVQTWFQPVLKVTISRIYFRQMPSFHGDIVL